MIPTMGLCYMLQYMDKLALSQAVLLNLRKDLVSDTYHTAHPGQILTSYSILLAISMHGALQSSTLDISHGAGLLPI